MCGSGRCRGEPTSSHNGGRRESGDRRGSDSEALIKKQRTRIEEEEESLSQVQAPRDPFWNGIVLAASMVSFVELAVEKLSFKGRSSDLTEALGRRRASGDSFEDNSGAKDMSGP